MSEKDEDNGKYYSMSEAYDDVKYAFGAGDTAKATAKMFAKSIFNIGKYAVTELPAAMVKEAERRKNLKD